MNRYAAINVRPIMMSAFRWTVASTVAIVLCASNALAQNVVRETASAWKNAKPLTLTAQTKWCASADMAGCDFKSIDDLALLPDGGI
ncbi:MAG: hypothetical protein ABI852_07490, partial [Gemmatimonadaceae bacterium]